jgi:hypothetical protein
VVTRNSDFKDGEKTSAMGNDKGADGESATGNRLDLSDLIGPPNDRMKGATRLARLSPNHYVALNFQDLDKRPRLGIEAP